MLIPSIDILGGQAVQLEGGDPAKVRIEAGDPRPLAERFAVVGELAVIDLDAALGTGSNETLIHELVRTYPCRVGGGIRSVEAARRWLDAGAQRVMLGTAARPDILSELPRQRVIAAVDARDGQLVVEGWRTHSGENVIERILQLRDLVGGFLATFVEREGRMGGTDLERARAIVMAAGGARVTIAGGITTEEEVRALDRLGADAQVGMALYSGTLDLADALAGVLESDRPDGLWPTVVCDEAGTALGLAYSSRASLRRAVGTRQGVYYSRSRQELWSKGATSGDTQELLRIDVDCDRDTLRFTVRQQGRGYCHLGTRTCFGDDRGIHRLARRLSAPRETRDAHSYTTRLLNDHQLLAAKIREEAAELCAARSCEDVIHEAADMVYFLLARLASAGVNLTEVERELDCRALKVSRRSGDAKLSSDVVVPRSAPQAGRCLPLLVRDQIPLERPRDLDEAIRVTAARILAAVQRRGLDAVRAHAIRLGDLQPDQDAVLGPETLARALESLAPADRAVLERTADRIRSFAVSQRGSLDAVTVDVPGGAAGHWIAPVERAGCYAPGGRFPLPSSVLMTVIPARVAGVEEVWVASPRPTPVTLAAAAIAGANGLLAVGGAQAIGALAYGAHPVPACDVVVGPGNRWVTAAKQLVAASVRIDFLAGPSELLVLADETADACLVAADLLAQAEHDPQARPMLVATDANVIEQVERALDRALHALSTAGTARAALANGFALLAEGIDEAIALADRIAPEHLQIMTRRAEEIARRCRHYGAVFIGQRSAEVLGDYGIGPNHTLPTGGTARSFGGLNVLNFLRIRTWLRIDGHATAALQDAAQLADLEGLPAHAAAARIRS